MTIEQIEELIAGHADGGNNTAAQMRAILTAIKQYLEEETSPGGLIIQDGLVINEILQQGTAIAIDEDLTELFQINMTERNNVVSMTLSQLLTVLNNITFQSNSGITTIAFPLLEECGNLTLSNNTVLAALNLASLITINGQLTISICPLLVTLNLSNLADVGGTINIGGGLTVTTINLSGLITAGNISISSPALTSLNINHATEVTFWDLRGCAFPQAMIDELLDALDDAGQNNGTVWLQGGTSATPSAAGLTSKANLVGRGWTVSHN